jgi:uncharacterized protein
MEMKKILITGGTGFIGSYLCEKLLQSGHYLTIITRSPEKYAEKQANNRNFIGWDDNLKTAVNETDVVINLAGESIAGRRWTDQTKKRILNSRVQATRTLVEAMKSADSKPELFISASGINYYKGSGDKILDESAEAGEGFLSQVCVEWEAEALKAAKIGIRTAIPRISMVLGEQGGALSQMKLPFNFFAGGPIGNGEQYVSWIHLKDLCSAILYPMEQEELSGVYNACSPNPVTMNTFAQTLGKVMNRPAFFRVPEFMLKIILGEASQMVLDSIRAKPKMLQITGFEFEFEDPEEALADVV